MLLRVVGDKDLLVGMPEDMSKEAARQGAICGGKHVSDSVMYVSEGTLT